MTDERKDQPRQDPHQHDEKHQTPAHSTPEERERLKDFNKDGIPPGAC